MSTPLRDAFAAGFWAGAYEYAGDGEGALLDGRAEETTVRAMFEEWIDVLASEEAQRYKRMQELVRWMAADVDIRVMVSATCKTHDVSNAGELANLEPLLFDELHEAAKDLLEQIPKQERPGWMGR